MARMRDYPFTLRGLVKELAERGVRVDYRAVWTLAHDEGAELQKNRIRQRASAR
jgi:transposase